MLSDPIHPAFVHLPVALITFSVITDWLGRLLDNDSLRRAGRWAIVGAAVGALLSVPAGLYDEHRYEAAMSPAAHEMVEWHMKVGIAVLIVAFILAVWRWMQRGTNKGPSWGYLVVLLLGTGLVFYQGWLGGKIVFEHGVGVSASAHSMGTQGSGGDRGGDRS